MSRLTFVLVLFSLACQACQGSRAAERGPATVYVPSPGATGQPPAERLLTTSGKATLVVAPDLAEVRVSLEVENVRTSTRAAAQINAMKARLLGELDRLSIKRDQAIVSTINLRPIYSPYVPGKLARIIGYNARSNVTIELRDFERIAPVLDASVRSGATRVTTGFRSTKLTELKRQVYDMALKAARSKAEQMAAALDIKSLRVKTVSEGHVGGAWGGWQSHSVANAVAQAPRQMGGATENVTPGSKELTLTISLVYEIM